MQTRALVLAGVLWGGTPLLSACRGAGVDDETGPAAGPNGSVTALVGARIVDGVADAPIDRGTILVRDGRVEAIGPAEAVSIPAGARRIDLAGRTIVPGLINAHGHVGETFGLRSGPEFYTRENIGRQLDLYARYGVTTVFSLGGDGPAGVRLRDGQNGPHLARARLFVAGPVVTADTPEAASGAVDALADLQVDFVKIRVDDSLGTATKMAPAVYRAVIQRAHEHGLPVAAHIFYLQDAKDLLRAGVDFIAHSIRDRAVDAELIALLRQRDVCVCPTLTREVSTFVYERTPEFFGDPFFLRHADSSILEELRDPARQERVRSSRSAQAYKKALEVASRNLKTLADAGIRIAFGTDTGPPARFQGYFEHMELELMAQAGLTPWQIVMSATRDAARCLRVAGRLGTLEPGGWADLIVLERNPLDDVRHLRTIESVWIAGNTVPDAPAMTE